MMQIVVIGGGAAGASAAARARRLNPLAKVLLIEATNIITHGPCGIPYAISGLVDPSNLITYTPEEFSKERGIEVLTNTKATYLDMDKKEVEVFSLSHGRTNKIKWDKLILATGATPSIPKIPGVELNGVVSIRHPANTSEIKDVLDRSSRVAVVGGSYLGLEMVEALITLGKKVMLFEAANHLLPTSLDTDIASVVADEVIRSGVELHLNEGVIEIRGTSSVKSLLTTKGEYSVDAVVLATGVKPNTKLASEAGIKLGVTGAVEVNEFMETNVEGVYAAGDVAEKTDKITGRKVWVPLAPIANKEGQVAGANAVSGRLLKFRGIVGTAITKYFNLYVARTGLTEKEASRLGIKYESKVIRTKSKAHYYPGASDIYVKLIVSQSDGRLLGAQIIGYDHIVAGYVDVAAVAIERGMTFEDLFFADLSYMPATAPVWHPLVVAARVFSRGRF